MNHTSDECLAQQQGNRTVLVTEVSGEKRRALWAIVDVRSKARPDVVNRPKGENLAFEGNRDDIPSAGLVAHPGLTHHFSGLTHHFFLRF
jgi:hypothetical protein